MAIKYPCIEVNLTKVNHNAKEIYNMCRKKDIDIFCVSKVFCSEEPIVESILETGIKTIADSRIENLLKLEKYNCEKVLLRVSMQSEAEEVVKYSDISLNSELETVKALSREASKQNKIHRVVLMIDLGDLREGVLEEDALNTAKQVMKLENIELYGLGTNLTCYGGVIPDDENLGRLLAIKEVVEESTGHRLKLISGGNSSSLYKVINESMPSGINNLRIGEAIVLGRETAYGEDVPNCHKDCFIIKGEIVELKKKPSVPKGTIGMDAFGEKPVFKDRGLITRAIIAIGRQDINPDGLYPLDKGISIIGASSDHLLLDLTESERNYKTGDIVEFNVDYGTLLKSMTSPYVKKIYIK